MKMLSALLVAAFLFAPTFASARSHHHGGHRGGWRHGGGHHRHHGDPCRPKARRGNVCVAAFG